MFTWAELESVLGPLHWQTFKSMKSLAHMCVSMVFKFKFDWRKGQGTKEIVTVMAKRHREYHDVDNVDRLSLCRVCTR